MSRKKKLIKYLILALPYIFYILRVLIQAIDELLQGGAFRLLRKLNLIEPQQQKKPNI
jgi:hypothetical protein